MIGATVFRVLAFCSVVPFHVSSKSEFVALQSALHYISKNFENSCSFPVTDSELTLALNHQKMRYIYIYAGAFIQNLRLTPLRIVLEVESSLVELNQQQW